MMSAQVIPTGSGCLPSLSFARLVNVTRFCISDIDPNTSECHLWFVSQVLAACLYPDLLKDDSLPVDVRQRARTLLDVCEGGSVGSYSLTYSGIPLIQKTIAEFITRRDGGVESKPENIIFSSGLERALSLVLHLLSGGEGQTRTGVLTPVPCPHTLPMQLDEAHLEQVSYQLLEEQGWALDLAELHRALRTTRGRCETRAIYISNPGNPTGHVQDRKTIEEVIRFAASESLVLLVEEVFQDSVLGQEKRFVSYRKVLLEMGEPYSKRVELVSLHSLCTAGMGECGLRGGYMEVINMDPAVREFINILPCSGSPPILPQLALGVMASPPSPGDSSYETFMQEVLHVERTLSHNARRACEFLNGLPRMSCVPAEAGIFLYPRLDLPLGITEQAQMLGVEPDVLFCQRFLEEEGVCVGPGCENGQDDDNFHIRSAKPTALICVLAPPAALEEVLTRLRSFHLRLLSSCC
uniref:alanine transaminase n=1 Tax=Nothobranchius furzeri TaxID=105023 RepID=A0A8C6MC90_NOTFU